MCAVAGGGCMTNKEMYDFLFRQSTKDIVAIAKAIPGVLAQRATDLRKESNEALEAVSKIASFLDWPKDGRYVPEFK